MIKRTLYFGNPAYLSLKCSQLVVQKPTADGDMLCLDLQGGDNTYVKCATIPIEDIGVVLLDHKQITVTQALLEALHQNNCAVITCDSKHMPCGLFLPLSANTVQNERFRTQIEASVPLKKQLWQQTIVQKIRNQEAVLQYTQGKAFGNMQSWSRDVRSGDADNLEARAAAFYWKTIFPDNSDFVRDRDEDGVNAILNYGYAILRAIVARAIVSSGMLPTLGIHHHNRYNAYCLADDIMEPYRPYVDKLVFDILKENPVAKLSHQTKVSLLSISTIEVNIGGRRSPLMVAASTTTASLYRCFEGISRKIIYPEIDFNG